MIEVMPNSVNRINRYIINHYLKFEIRRSIFGNKNRISLHMRLSRCAKHVTFAILGYKTFKAFTALAIYGAQPL